MYYRVYYHTFLVFFVLSHLSAVITTFNTDNSIASNLKYERYLDTPLKKGFCENQTKFCKITCLNGYGNSLHYDIEWSLLQNKANCSIIDELLIQNYTFEHETFSWIPIDKKIKTLKISNSQVKKIQSRAFAYYNLSELILERLPLTELSREALSDLENLKKLVIIQTKNAIIESVHEEFLKPVALSLVQLEINAGLISSTNLTNSCFALNKLIKVDLSFNDFRILSPKSFSQLLMVEDLNLSYSKIGYLPDGIFAPISLTLRNLDLSNNILRTFGAFIFEPPISTLKVLLRLDGNLWICTCPLQIFLKMLLIYEVENVKCYGYKTPHGIPILDAHICPDPNSSSTTVQTNPSSSTFSSNFIIKSTNTQIYTEVITSTLTPSFGSTEVSGPVSPSVDTTRRNMKLKCKVCEGPACNHMKKIDYNTIRVRPRKVDFIVRTLTDTSVTVKIVSHTTDSLALLWFNKVTTDYFKMEINYKEYGLGCFRNVSKSSVVTDLVTNGTYIFCLIDMEHSSISPFSCIGYRVPNSYRLNNIWLSESMKTICICVALLVILCSMFLGASIIFCIIKQKPTLLRGSKRVVMPTKSLSDIMVLPREGNLSKKVEGHNIHSLFSHSCLKRKRSASVDSSYVSPNLYEIIPPLRDESFYIENDFNSNTGHSFRMHTERRSNDPLPAIPTRTSLLPGVEFSNQHEMFY